jgi:hypothetical protein
MRGKKQAGQKAVERRSPTPAAGDLRYRLPSGYAVPKKFLQLVPGKSEEQFRKELEAKSAGKCDLGGEDLPRDPEEITIDHEVAKAQDGKEIPSNYFLVCRRHNSQKGDTPRDFARKYIRLSDFCLAKGTPNFEEVAREHFGIVATDCKFEIADGLAVLTFRGGEVSKSPLFTDPATNIGYFFAEVPIDHIYNDGETHPRWVIPGHVKELALDFMLRPVHEPSSSRILIDENERTARILQFDGQHKTIAQILIGRTRVQMKLYVTADVQALRELVEAIQNRIEKLRLALSATYAKVQEIIRHEIDEWKPVGGTVKSESAFVSSRPYAQRDLRKKQLREAAVAAVLDDPKNELKPYVEVVAKPGKYVPITDKNLVKHVIERFMAAELQTDDMTAVGCMRDIEKDNIVFLLSAVARNMFADWDFGVKKSPSKKGYTARQQAAANFSYGGAMAWWSKTLIGSLRAAWGLPRKHEGKILMRVLSDDQRARLEKAVEVSCRWALWVSPEGELEDAWRSNTPRRVDDAMGDLPAPGKPDKTLDYVYNENTLYDEVREALPAKS